MAKKIYIRPDEMPKRNEYITDDEYQKALDKYDKLLEKYAREIKRDFPDLMEELADDTD